MEKTVFRNFHLCELDIEGKRNNSKEQYYQFQMLWHYKENGAAERVCVEPWQHNR